MSDRFRGNRKRGTASDDEADGEAPKYADAETMSQRRIVRVVRSTPTGPPPSLGGVFKSLPTALPAGAPTLATKFGSTAEGATRDGGAPSLSLTGSAAVSSSATDNLGTDADKGSKADAESVRCDGLAEGKPLFGGDHNFGNAVNSFVAAKERLAKKAEENHSKEVGLVPSAGSAPGDALANAVPVSVPAGEVVASVSSRLYLFKAESRCWSDCGVGEAKIKKQETSGGDGQASGVPNICYRLLVRDGYALNTLLSENFIVSKAEGTHAIFSFPLEGKVATYLLKYTGPAAAESGPAFSKALNEMLKLAQGRS